MLVSIDTNIFIAFLIPPISATDEKHFTQAKHLMQAIEAGDVTAIVSEIVLHECHYVMVSRAKSLTVMQFCGVFRDILAWPGWRIRADERDIYLRALDILQQQPKLEFSDAVIAARAGAHGATLATFDKRLAAAFDGPIWDEA